MTSVLECAPVLMRIEPVTDVATLRAHVAIVRTLLDEFERALSRRNGDDGPGSAAEQLHDEIARFSHRMREVSTTFPASLQTRVVPIADASGPRCIDAARDDAP